MVAQTHVASDERPPAPAYDAEVAAPERKAAPRLTLAQHALRSFIILVVTLVCAVLFAPVILAIATAIWALVTEGIAVLSIERLIRQGEILQTAPAMDTLSVASRIGFGAVGYLGLFCALMALLAGLLGRGRGRLFIIPGALLTTSALILFATSIALAAPLLDSVRTPHAVWVGGALYLAVDTVTLATLLTDTSGTRRRWFRRPRLRARPPQMRREPPGLPPTLAGV